MPAVPLQPLTLLTQVGGGDLGWQDDALCTQIDPGVFYPEVGVPATVAKQICAKCEVGSECLEAALRTDAQWGEWGVWAGLSANQRRRERLRRNRAAA